MDLGIAGRTALVCGGSKGMGRAAARQLGLEGCKVAVVARGQEAIDATVRDIVAAGGDAVGISADLTLKDGVARALDACTEAYGHPDIVIHQNQDMQTGNVFEVADEAFVEVFRIFTMSTVYMAKAVIPQMRRNGWGRFVHIGSGTAKEPETRFPHLLANVARPSTVGLLKTIADEVAADGVTVNTVAPGWIHTPALEAFFEERGMSLEEGGAWLKREIRIPAARAGTAEEIASMIVYLCSAQAGYVSGAWITVNGGNHRSIF